MPEREKLVNLGGVMEGFPTLAPGTSGEGNPFDPSGDVAAPPSVNDFFNSLGSGTAQGRPSIPVSSFYTGKRFNSSLPGTDTEEMAAQQQPWLDKWGNALVKMTGTAATTFVSGTAGLLYGVGAAAKDGRFSSLYDNDVTRSMDDVSKQLEDELPNYYTHQERDANWYSPDNLWTANFWADKVLKNLGFSAGAIGGGLAWSSLFRGIGLTNELVKAGRALELIEATEQVMTIVPKTQQYGALQSTLNSLSQQFLKPAGAAILKNSDRLLTSTMGTFGEASMEALHNLNDFRTKLIDEYKGKYGVAPTGAELDEINDYADKVGNYTWGFNTMLLSATNYIMLPKILGSSRTADKLMLNDIIKNSEGKFTAAPTRLINKTISGAGLLFSPTEAFEEGSQFAIQIGTQEYFNRAYQNKEDVSEFFSNISKVMGTVSDEGVDRTFSTKEGMENILIGGISGGLQQGISNIKERGVIGTGGQRKKNTDLAVSALNKTNLQAFLGDGAKYVARGINSQKLRQEAILNNDVLSEKDYELDYALSYILPRIKYGKIDSLNEEVDGYLQQASTEQGFLELKNAGVVSQNETKEDFIERANSIKTVAQNSDKLYNQIKDKYSNFVNKKGEQIYSDDVIDRMVYSAAKVEDYNKRISELSLPLISNGIDTFNTMTDVVSGKSEKFNEAADSILKLDVNSDVKDELLQQLIDVSEMSVRRKQYIDEYDKIKRSPEQFKEPVVPSSTEPKETITVKTKTGETELSVGEEYFVGKIVEDENGKNVYQFPKLTILGENEDGTIKIKDGNGVTRDVSKTVLEGYKLGKVSDTLSNKKAKFFMEHANTIYKFNFGKGKKKPGRLEYSHKEGILNFVYKDDNGKIKRREVKNKNFVPKKGYTHALLEQVGEVTPAQKKSLAEYLAEKEAERRDKRLEILNDLFTEVSAKHEKLVKLIGQKRKEIDNINEDLAELQDNIANAEFDARSKKALRFRANGRRALEAAMKLSRTKEQLEKEVESLEAERDELELNAEYITDLTTNLDELPTDSKEFLEDLKQQKDYLESLILETGSNINSISKLITNVEKALETAVSYLREVVGLFEKAYPKAPLALGQEWVDFLQSNPNFLKNNPLYKEHLERTEELIAQVEDLDIKPNERTINELKAELTSLEKALAETEKELKSKSLILDKFEEIAEQYQKQKEEELKIANDAALRKEILGTAYTGTQTVVSGQNYEPEKKKSNIQVVTSTKSVSSDEPHHVRANEFGVNFPNLPNRDKIKGVLVTAKNEAQLGLTGLIDLLVGDSDADPSKVIALVMVQDGRPVGVDGVPIENTKVRQLEEGKEVDLVNSAIFQVMPDPKLEWTKEYGGGTMFRKETTPEQIEYYKKQYQAWVKEVLESDNLTEHNIVASFGVPQYVTFKNEKGDDVRDYTATVSVEDAGLVKASDLIENQLIKIPTADGVAQKGSTLFNDAQGRPFLNLPNGYVKLNNRKLNKNEAATIYEAIHQLAIDIFKNGDVKSKEAKRLYNWLKSIIYWGTPKNAAGYNSIWFDTVDGEFQLFISGKDKSYSFTPSSLEQNKSEIITLLEGMYNNINSTLSQKDGVWQEEYEQIISISPDGKIEAKVWPNYQSYLLSKEGRKAEELPLFTQMKPVTEGQTNREGIYFTIKDTVDKFTAVPEKTVLKPKTSAKTVKSEEVKTAPEGTFVLDGKEMNVYVSPAGKKINFFANATGDKIIISPGRDLPEILQTLTEKLGEEKAKENIKNIIRQAIAPFITEEDEESLTIEDEKEEAPKAKKSTEQKPAKIEVSKEEEDEMTLQMDDLEDDVALRVNIHDAVLTFGEENWPKVQQWLKDNFPNLPVYRVKNMIEGTNGLQAWGMLKDGAIYVTTHAEVGTIYHEVFEGVWKMFTYADERNAVNAEFRNREGSFIDRPTGKTIKFSEATDEQIKEQLAEEFRDFILYEKAPQKPKNKKGILAQIFSDIAEFIRTFFTGKKSLNNTETLFNKIGTGYYKQYTPTSQFSYAEKGLIDIEEAYIDKYSELRVKNIPADVVNDIMQHMTYITLTDLIKSNKSLFSLPKVNRTDLYKRLKENVTATALKSRKEAEELVRNGEATQADVQKRIDSSILLRRAILAEWKEIEKKHEEYLKVYSIEFDENDDIILKDENASKKGDYQDASKIDHFKKANSAIKLLLSTIPIVKSDGKLVHSSINGAKLLPTSQVFMAIMNNVHTSRNIDEMMERLKKMSEEDDNYKTLYTRLTKNASDLSQISEPHDAQLLAAFWRTFKKQQPDVKNVYIFENGSVEVGDSNLATAARQISSDYNNAIVKTVRSDNPYFEYSAKDRVFIGKPIGVKNIVLDSDEKRIKFLSSLGIDFKINEINKLPADKLEAFIKATAGIKSSIAKADKIATISRKVLDIKGDLMQLSLVRASIDNPEFDSTFFNVKGERTQSFVGTNHISDFFDYIQQVNNKKELIGTPYEYLLTDDYAQNSVILNKIFNSETGNKIERTEQLMKPGYADGTINTETGKKKESSKQTYKERIIQEINLNLAGYYYNLVPGDASMEWMVYMGNHISYNDLVSDNGKTERIFKGYFLSEYELSKDGRKIVDAKNRSNKDLRFFKAILGEELHGKIIKEKLSAEEAYVKYEKQINSALNKFIRKETTQLRASLEKYSIVESTADGSIEVESLSFSKGNTITEDTLERNLEMLSINYIINNIELHKLLYSDPYQYSDELKRIKNASSPRQAIINNSPLFNTSLNKIWNEGYTKDDIGNTDFTRDYFTSVTLADVPSTSELKDYGVFEETDGGGLISMKANRWFRIKAGEWTDEEENQYKYDVAFEKDIKKLPLSKEEKELLEGKNPDIKSAYTPLKPIVFGNKLSNENYNNIVLDKFSLYPVSFRIMYSINPDSNAVKNYNKMQRENTDYQVFASGRKVGNEGTNSLYNTDGSFNELPYTNFIKIPHSIISIQSEVPSKEDATVSRGSQITKLVTMDYMEAGVPIDFKGGREKWEQLTKDQKKEASPLYKEIQHNQELLEEMTIEAYDSLLVRMGIKETEDGDFIIEDATKVSDMLESEVLKREVNDNIIDAFAGFKKGDVVLEATPAYQQIRNILYSIADKNIISPKISGGLKVQLPSTLLESVRAKEEKGAYSSDFLKFYEDKDGQRVCEMMIGRWFDSDLSDDELLDYLNNTEEGRKILSGVAYRIPTQKQNSIDSFRIKQFLPREFGDSVIIPSALVKKVGSDFDIDKLYIYLKNTFRDAKNKVKLVPFYGYGQQAKDKFTKLFYSITEEKIRDKEAKLIKQDSLHKLFGELALGTTSDKTAQKWIPILREWFADEMIDNKFPVAIIEEIFMSRIEKLGKSIDTLTDADLQEALSQEAAEKWYKQSLENEYIQSLQNLISHELNFENLVKPNSADQLKALAKEINKKLGKEEVDYTSTGNMLNREFMSGLRQAFVSGKYAIGIAAVNQTNHSLNQRQPIYIDADRWNKGTAEDLFWLTGGTMNSKDISVKFKNYNKIVVDGKTVPTLSMIKNADGQNISDIIGQFIDGYVDISKGPWIMELGATSNVAGVWLFLTKIGVPINEVAYFMNQPIIKDYLASIENAGYSWLFIDNFVQEIKDSPKYKVSAQEVSKVKQIPSSIKSTVGKENLSPNEKAEQQFMLTEFLKYAKMANHMFLVTQGSNWDTANFNDGYLVFKKQEQFKKAQSTIISSVDEIVKNSFVRKLSETIQFIRDAFATVLPSDRGNVRSVIEKVLTPYIDMNDRDFVKLAQKAVNDLFDWAVQNDRKLNTQVEKILLSDENTAKQVSDFVTSVRKNPEHPLYNNQVIKLITPHFADKEGGVNNLKIKNKDNKVYDQNQMIYAFAEIRNYLKGQNDELYRALTTLSVLQSGLSNSPISFTSLLPYEDFKKIYNKTLSTLEEIPNLQNFHTLNVFQRNNWNDNDWVPHRKAKWKQNKKGEWKYNNNMKFFGHPRVTKAIDKELIPQLVKISTLAREAATDVIVYSWEEGSKNEKAEKKKKGDYSYIKRGLFKKIYKGSTPFTVSFTTDEGTVISEYVYKAINAWGESKSSDGIYFGANEFYSVGKPSVIDNGFITVEKEQADGSILTYFETEKKEKISNTKEDSSTSKIPC